MPLNAGDCAHESVARKIPIPTIRLIMKTPHLTKDNHAGISVGVQGGGGGGRGGMPLPACLRHNGTTANDPMVGVYGRYRDQRDRDENRWIMGIIEEAKAEQERNPMSTERMLKESDRLSRHGARQAQKLGIRQQDIDRIVHDYRARKQA
jgi:hypothetical protein